MLGSRRKVRVGLATAEAENQIEEDHPFGRTKSEPEMPSSPIMNADAAWKLLGRRQRERMANVHVVVDTAANPGTDSEPEPEPDRFARTRSTPDMTSFQKRKQPQAKGPKIADLFFQQELSKLANEKKKAKASLTKPARQSLSPVRSSGENSRSSSRRDSVCSREGSRCGSFRLRSPSQYWRQRDRRRSSTTGDLHDIHRINDVSQSDSFSRMGLMFTDAAHLVRH